MADSIQPASLGLAIFLARTLRGWSQTDLADASGLTSSMVSEYERGRRNPSKKSLESLLEAMDIPLESLHRVIPTLERFRDAVRTGVAAQLAPKDVGRLKLEPLTDGMVRSSLELIFHGKMVKREFTPGPRDREEAPELWAVLRSYEAQDQFLLIEEGKEYQSWAMCELACHYSAEAARDDPARALELAGVALRIAERTPGSEAWRSRVQGYAWAHVGNARRASGDLPGADEALLKAGLLWRAGAEAHPGLLDEAKLREIDEAIVGT